MKHLLAIVLILTSCAKHEDNKKKEQAFLVGYFLGCQFTSANSLFVDPYYGRYISDRKQYEKIIIGDSTMDIACNTFAGYVGSGYGIDY